MVKEFLKNLFLNVREVAFSQLLIIFLLIYQVSIVSKGLGVEDYGRVGLITVFAMTVFKILHSKNSDVTLLILKNRKHSIFLQSIFFDLIVGFISYMICIMIIRSSFNDLIGSYDLNLYLNLFLFSKIFQTISETTKAHLIYQGEYKTLAFYETFPVIVRFVFIFAFFLYEPSVSNYLICYSIYSFVYATHGILIYKKKLTLFSQTSYSFITYFQDMKKAYLKQRADQLTGIIPQNLDLLILGYFTDYSSVGIFRIAKRLAEPINLIINSLVPIVQNNLSNNKDNFQLNDLIKYLLIPLSLTIFLFYFFIGEQAIKLISGQSFISAYEPLLFVSIGYLIYLNTFWIRQILLFKNKIQYHTYGRLINTLIFLIIVSSLIINFGVSGLAVALSISVLVQKIFEYFIYKKILSN